jgi:hypothetical protein
MVVFYTSATDTASRWIDNHVNKAVINELENKNSLLQGKIQRNLLSALEDENNLIGRQLKDNLSSLIDAKIDNQIGSVQTGRFGLGRNVSTNTIFVYAPPGHSVNFTVHATNFLGSEVAVRILCGKGNREISQPGNVTFDTSELCIEDPEGPLRLDGNMKHLKQVTFMLRRKSASVFSEEAQIRSEDVDISYVSMLTPPVRNNRGIRQ